MPLTPPPMFGRLYDLPDLDFIRRHGFAEEVGDPAQHATGPISSDTARAQQECQQRTSKIGEQFRASYVRLQASWLNALSEIQTEPAVVRAYSTVGPCFRQAGINANDESGFFEALGHDKRSPNAAEHRYAVAYAHCMRAVEQARIPARHALRARFLAAYEEQVRNLETTLIPQLQQLSGNTGVPIQFPVV